MIKKYRSWNKFERRYFWSNMVLTMLGTYPVIYSLEKYKFITPIVLIPLLVYYNHVIHKNLTNQEREWKGIVLDPITKKEVFSNG